MVYNIRDFIFDSDRQILYRNNVNEQEIKYINSMVPSNAEMYDKTYSVLSKINSQKMCMNKVEIDTCGIMPTYNCNLRCEYCAYSSGGSNCVSVNIDDVKVFFKDIIKRKVIKRLISKHNDALLIDMTGGGEPTYEWELLIKIVDFVKKECNKYDIPFRLSLVTNGVLSDDKISFIGEHFDKITISYDGLPEIQNKNRVGFNGLKTNSYVENTIKKLSQIDAEVTVRTTISRDDFPRIQEMYNHIVSIIPAKGKVIWSVWPIQYEGRALKSDCSDTSTKALLRDCMKLRHKIALNNTNRKICELQLPIFIDDACDMFCGATTIVCPWLLPDSTIVTCVESPDGKVTIGRVKDGQVNYYKEYRDMFLEMTQRRYIECRNCMVFYYCRGGCPMWHYRKEHSGHFPHECDLQVEYLTYIIEAALDGDFVEDWKLTPLDLPDLSECVYKIEKN